MSIVIEKVQSDAELKKVAGLADAIWHECFVDIISVEQIDYMVKKFQSYEAMKRQLGEEYSYFSVYENDELIGYFAVRPEKDDRFFLSKLYLRIDKRGKGYASEMLRKVFSEAAAQGKKRVYLTVNKHNEHAIAVYSRTGFAVTDAPVSDIGNGFVMDDYVMEYKL